MEVRAGLRETRGAQGLAADRGKLVPPLDLKCHKGSKPEPIESWSMEDRLPDRNCSCRGTQPLLEMWRWSRETWHSGDSACSLSPCPESLAGTSNWLDPVGRHQGIQVMQYVGVSSHRARSSAENKSQWSCGQWRITSRSSQSELPRSGHSTVVVQSSQSRLEQGYHLCSSVDMMFY